MYVRWGRPVLTDRVDEVLSDYLAVACFLGLVVGVFIGVGTEVAEAGVRAAGVVPAFDVVEDRFVRGGTGGPAAAVDEFGFDAGTALDRQLRR